MLLVGIVGIILLCLLPSAPYGLTSDFKCSCTRGTARRFSSTRRLAVSNGGKDGLDAEAAPTDVDDTRRELLSLSAAAGMASAVAPGWDFAASAAAPGGSKRPNKGRPAAPPPPLPSPSFEQLTLQTMSSELNLLRTLPVFKYNSVLTSLASKLASLNSATTDSQLEEEIDQLWRRRGKDVQGLLSYFDAKRYALEGVFRDDDSMMKTITRQTREETLLSGLRANIMLLIADVDTRNSVVVEKRVQKCLLLLGEVAEL